MQTLSRLNRSAPELGKRTEDLFVLDFFNSVSDIKEAFDPYYTSTTLSGPTDVNVLHDLKDALDDVGVYDRQDVAASSTISIFHDAVADQLSPIIDVCAARFTHELELEEDEQADFKIKAKQFVKIYAQVAASAALQPRAVGDALLVPQVPHSQAAHPGSRPRDAWTTLLESVDLSTYGLERGQAQPEHRSGRRRKRARPAESQPTRRAWLEEGKDPLDEIIRVFNERWFAGWDATPEEQRVKFIHIAQHVANNPDYVAQVVNNQDEQNRRLALEKLISQAVGQERKRELDLYKRYASDPDFKRAFDVSIRRILEGGLGDMGLGERSLVG